jgi:hypothetical protein
MSKAFFVNVNKEDGREREREREREKTTECGAIFRWSKTASGFPSYVFQKG